MRVVYPLTALIVIATMVLTAAISVSWHPLLLALLGIDLLLIFVMPVVARREGRRNRL
jgi:ABC-type transport system involved in cytochrome bd biosynthesis fused ATPase/permease subunit